MSEKATKDAKSSGRSGLASEVQKLRDENQALQTAVIELSHAQLIARDVEMGLRAELFRAREDAIRVKKDAQYAVSEAEYNASMSIKQIRASNTWRIGRIVTKPLALVRRSGR